MIETLKIDSRPPTVEGNGMAVPSECRLALALERSVGTGEKLLQQHPGLRRLYLAGPAAPKVLDSRIRYVALQSTLPLEQMLENAFRDDLLYFAEGKVALLLTDADRRTEPDLCTRLSKALLDHTRRVLSTVALHATRGWHMLANSLLNLPRALNEHAVTELAGLAHNRAVVIAGAGPSLDKNAAELKAFRERVFLVACDAACATLLRAGIRPDLIVTSDDSERIWRYFAPFQKELLATPAVCLLQSNWPTIRHHRGPLYFGLSHSASGAVFHEAVGLPFFDAGQCVGHAALEVALLLGGAPIVMIGFDLGYSGERFHPKDMQLPYFHLHPPPQANLTHVMGIDGRPVLTDLSMAMYLREFERRIALTQTPVWDATEGGALKKGARLTSLKNALSEIAAISPDPIRISWPNKPAAHAAFSDVKARWLRQIGKLFIDMDALVASSGVPDIHSFLIDHQELVAFISDADNLADVAAFRFAWDDWTNHLLSASEMRQRVLMQLSEIAGYARLASTLLSPPALPEKPRKAMFFANTPHPAGLERLFQSLEKLGLELAGFQGDPGNFPELWEIMMQQSVELVLIADDALMPAAWAMPGRPCIEWKSRPPADQCLPEQWLPGYAVICPNPETASAWRNIIPADRPVMLLSPDGSIHPAEQQEAIENWTGFLTRLVNEAGAATEG
ncbi:MAG TPA: hypothetical protein DCZ95_17185 [Verrucomicrobia bacterium]|nr:MAG: hypothetical protein A2X46_09665 [Lentisphaerae bacterium GWF2_57_35]HBA85820.1 hypothetical protein [Verrucomicrobiota bacterium]